MSKLAYIWKLHPVSYRKEWVAAITSTFTLMQFSATYRTRISVGQCSYLIWSPEIDQYQRPSALRGFEITKRNPQLVKHTIVNWLLFNLALCKDGCCSLVVVSLVPYDRVGRCSSYSQCTTRLAIGDASVFTAQNHRTDWMDMENHAPQQLFLHILTGVGGICIPICSLENCTRRIHCW